MGEGKKRSQVKRHTQRISKVPVGELTQTSIFGGSTAVVSDVVTCYYNDSQPWPSPNATLQFVDFGKEFVDVVYGVRVIGHVDESGSQLLRFQYGIGARTGSRINGRIVELNVEWSEFRVKIL